MTKVEMLNWLRMYSRVGHLIRLVEAYKFSSDDLELMKRQLQPTLKLKAKFKKTRGA